MLQHEIEPFGDAHIKAQTEILDQIQALLGQSPASHNTVLVDREKLMDWYEKARTARQGFARFQACALDEWKQKERYRKFAIENGYPYS